MVVVAGSSSADADAAAAPSATAAAGVDAVDAADLAVAAAVAAVAVGGVSSRFGAVVAVGKDVVEADEGAENEGCVVVAAAVSVAEEFSSCNTSSSPELLSRAHSMGVENSASTSAGRFSSTEAADDDISLRFGVCRGRYHRRKLFSPHNRERALLLFTSGDLLDLHFLIPGSAGRLPRHNARDFEALALRKRGKTTRKT